MRSRIFSTDFLHIFAVDLRFTRDSMFTMPNKKSTISTLLRLLGKGLCLPEGFGYTRIHDSGYPPLGHLVNPIECMSNRTTATVSPTPKCSATESALPDLNGGQADLQSAALPD